MLPQLQAGEEAPLHEVRRGPVHHAEHAGLNDAGACGLTGRKSVLITGGSGFIGRNLAQGLSRDYEITAPRHGELDLLSRTDTRRFLTEHDFDFVIHCANVGGNRKTGDTAGTVEKNLRMFLNLTEDRSRFGRMIHFGSGAEYDKSRPLVRVREDEWGERVPRDDYGFSKFAISRCIEGMDNVCCLRLFGVFGPGEDYEYKFISNAIVKNLLGMPITIMQNVCFDWLYVDDLVRLVGHFLEREPRHRFYNATSGCTTDLVTVARLVNANAAHPSEICVANEGLNREYSGDNSRLMQELGSFGFTDVSDAIARLTEHYRATLDAMDKEKIRRDPYARLCTINKPSG